MKLILFLLTFAVLNAADTQGQAKLRKMSSTINHPSLNVFAPYISADANAIVFVSDNAEDHALTPFFSLRENADWQEPQVLPKTIYTRLNFLRGYGLSADGGTLYFSTMKSPGVGGFDIWTSEWKTSVWGNPVNLGAPINSRAHEACASVTADGKTLYFMRCDKMDQNRAEQCKIFRVDKKSNGLWGDPVELPESINTGNSQTPRIMADAETLIFSSDKMGSGKGGMDLFMTKFQNGEWTNPVPLDFVNTDKDDQYVSATGLGRYLIRDSPGARKNEVVEYLIPQELRPRGMMKVDGRVTDSDGKPVAAYISLVDTGTGQRIYNGRPNSDGSFLLYAMEGNRYELAIDPEHGDKSYFSKILDLTKEPIPQVEKVRAVLKPLVEGAELVLDGISFRENTSEIDLQNSERALQRLARIVTSNPGLRFEVEVMLEGYEQDTIQSNPDLTEMFMDTVYWKYIDIDTLGQLFERDTASLKSVYHNDRTQQQAQSIIDYLVSRGAKQENLVGLANALPAVAPESKKTLIKARIISM
jgi:hypothetical protein